MSPVAPSSLLALVAVATTALAQSTAFVPLVDKHFTYPDLPYQVDTDNLVRGTQSGYNLCNATTENQQSLCQTSFLNHLDDFCLWGPPNPNSVIGDTEGEEVAWCTHKGHGTRLVPAGALKGVQMTVTPGYVQVVGFIDQTLINIQDGDTGGELDAHGADLRGNPLGGLVFSNAFSGNNDTYDQVIEWHNFMGSNQFCFKACRDGPEAPALCQHIYDRIGVQYNCPSQAQEGVFEVCEGENQDAPGIYTSDGQVLTYTQPPESDGVISTMPYTPRIPSSSNCRQFQSADLYSGLPGGTTTTTSSGTTPTSPGSAPTGGSSSGTGTRSGTSGGPSPTGANDDGNGAAAMGVSLVSTLAGVVAAVALLA